MKAEEQAAEYIKQGAIQLSRKYQIIGVPPELPEGWTFLDMLRELDPILWFRLETIALEHIIRVNPTTHHTLPVEVFNEWLRQTGRTPSKPPAPFESWAAYWKEKKNENVAERTTGPSGVPTPGSDPLPEK